MIDSLRGCARALPLVLSMLAFGPPVNAQDTYHGRPGGMVIPFAAGGGADVVGRLIASRLADRLGQNVVADNRTGAGGVIGSLHIFGSAS